MPPEAHTLSQLFKLCLIMRSFLGRSCHDRILQSNVRTAVGRGRVFLSLGEALHPDYNLVAKCRQKGRTPPVVSDLRQSVYCRSTTTAPSGP